MKNSRDAVTKKSKASERSYDQSEIAKYRPEWAKVRQNVMNKLGQSGLELSELAWAAGLFDGEGHAGASDPNNALLRSPTIELSIEQKYGELGYENLVRFYEAVGRIGNVRKINRGGARWRTRNEVEVEKVWNAIGPFLGLAKFIQFQRACVVPAIRHLRNEALGRKKTRERQIVSVTVPDRGSDLRSRKGRTRTAR